MDNQYHMLSIEHPPKQSVIVRIARSILDAAIRDGATELRLLPGTCLVRSCPAVWSPLLVQCLTDGIWSDLPSLSQCPGVMSAEIMRVYKVLADVNPFSSKGPQEGCFRFYNYFNFIDEKTEPPSKIYLIHASFQEGSDGVTTLLTIQDAGDAD